MSGNHPGIYNQDTTLALRGARAAVDAGRQASRDPALGYIGAMARDFRDLGKNLVLWIAIAGVAAGCATARPGGGGADQIEVDSHSLLGDIA